MQLSLRDRARDERTSGPVVVEERRGAQRRVLGLIVHVLAAGGEQTRCDHDQAR
jgi:hypothetical protein